MSTGGWICSSLLALWAVFYVIALISSRRERRHYEERGERLIGWIVQANNDLYSEGGIDKPAQILVAFDGTKPNDREMAKLAAKVADLKGERPEDSDEEEVAALVNDETYRPFKRFLLPERFTRGREVYSMHIWVERSKLPDRRLQHPFVRCLVIQDDDTTRPLMIEYEENDEDYLL